MRSDLQRLKRDTDSGRMPLPMSSAQDSAVGNSASAASAPSSSGQHSVAGESKSSVAPPAAASKPPYGKIVAAVGAVALLVAGIVFWQTRRSTAPAANSSGPRTLAVLPLQNLGADKDLDFLRLALADEIATSLSYVRSLTIRPFATTSKYDSPTLDLQEAGKAMHVTDVVTGHYIKEGNQLQLTLEAVDIGENPTVWRDTMTVAAPDLIAIQSEITAKVRQGLVPAPGAGADAAEAGRHPRNE